MGEDEDDDSHNAQQDGDGSEGNERCPRVVEPPDVGLGEDRLGCLFPSEWGMHNGDVTNASNRPVTKQAATRGNTCIRMFSKHFMIQYEISV